jgi:TonB family protein
MNMQTRTIVAAMALASFAAHAAAQDRLEPVRALYSAANYEAAIAALGDVESDADSRLALEADGYRVSCLLALGRPADADLVIERIVRAHPDFDPGAEASPRVRRAFRAVSNRVLPPLARQLYDDGKAAFDRGAFVEATQTFQQALPVLEALSHQGQPGMEDRRVLANNFLELSKRLTPPPPPAVAPRLESRGIDPAAYLPQSGTRDDLVTQPVVIRQDLPAWPGIGDGDALFQGAIDVLIEEHGSVIDARIFKSVHPFYDALLLEAARNWSYEPARRGGRPVMIWKRIAVTLRNR